MKHETKTKLLYPVSYDTVLLYSVFCISTVCMYDALQSSRASPSSSVFAGTRLLWSVYDAPRPGSRVRVPGTQHNTVLYSTGTVLYRVSLYHTVL